MRSNTAAPTEPKGGFPGNDIMLRCMQQSPHPYAITRGAEHALAGSNAAFERLEGAAHNGMASEALRSILDRAFLNSTSLTNQRLDLPLDGGSVWMCSAWPIIADGGLIEGLGVELREAEKNQGVLDLQRQVAEQMLLGALRERGFADEAEVARSRAVFLSEASRLLSESVDRTSTLIALTKLALPTLGGWCIVDIIEEGNTIRRLGIYHSNPEKQVIAQDLESLLIPNVADAFGAAAMLRSAATIEISTDVEVVVAGSALGVASLDKLRAFGIGSLLTVPLRARGKLLGAITFVGGGHDSSYSADEIHLAEDLGQRAALALDNAQMYELALVHKKNAESANNAKTAFLGAMSHELRTPLNAIGGYIDLLDMGLRGPVTDQQHADFARVRNSQRHLVLLISEILNFARAGSGGLRYVISNLKAVDAVSRAIDLIEPLFAQRGLVFDGIEGDAAITARADPERVTQILVNLLSNAIKFTAEGGHLRAVCAAEGDVVAICIEDTGIGIPAGKLETIFEPFMQLRDTLADRASGIGLGLAISRDLARAMNGDLTVESTEGRGSRFTLSLPAGLPLEPVL